MAESHISPYGTWKSPITSDLIAAGTIRLGQITCDGEDIYWIESRPFEEGRNVIVRRLSDRELTEINPEPFNARTRVHEYGGGVYIVDQGTVYFSHFPDQRLYRSSSGACPEPITPEEDKRYADGIMDSHRARLICVCEDHTRAGSEAINTLVEIDLDGKKEVRVLASGNDFYSSPRISPDGTHLAWLTWNHPNMPWDGCELWTGEIQADGSLDSLQWVAGGMDESIFQPEWSPDGILHFVSDRNGWWNLYRSRNGVIEPLCEMEAEFGRPQWLFGMSTYGFVSAQRILATYTRGGLWYLADIDTETGTLETIETPYTSFGSVQVTAEKAVFNAGSFSEPTAVVQFDLNSREFTILRRSSDIDIDPGYISIPATIEFPTENGLQAYAFFYKPKNCDYAAPSDERPPLIVINHGGPTGSASASFDLGIQFWSSRGFAVLDVNYGGSTGYGRAYISRLKGTWGIVDVADCVNSARYLVENGEVDSDRLIVRGGSAGGFTTLCALTFCDAFNAGASYYGVSDLEALTNETHKFESRYLDGLIGPYPASVGLYHKRSPIHSIERLSSPLILFQGLEDKIVLPNQAEMIYESLRDKGLPVAYVPFEAEQHGFRRAENIKRALENELYFYARVFDFRLPEKVARVHIENLD